MEWFADFLAHLVLTVMLQTGMMLFVIFGLFLV